MNADRLLTPSLFGVNILGVLTWLTSAQNFLGLVGALAGALSACMLVAINADKFAESRTGKWVLAKLRRASPLAGKD